MKAFAVLAFSRSFEYFKKDKQELES